MGRPGGAICAANAPRPAGCRVRPRAAAPCRNTTAAQAMPAKNPPIADQKTDSELPVECASLQDRSLQTWLAIRGQPLPRRLRDERRYSAWKHGSTIPTGRANPDVFRDLGSTSPDIDTHGPRKQTIFANGCEDTAAKTFLRPLGNRIASTSARPNFLFLNKCEK